jgi:ABC-2 type transport system permease protein
METLRDAWTVAQKELRELLSVRSSPDDSGRERLLLASTLVLVLGIALPIIIGPQWLDRSWLLALWAWTPVFVVAFIAADAVAGERERHTLETLLASRLSDRAILLGKVGAAVIYGWGLMLLTIVTSIVAINLVYARDALLLYRPMLLASGALLSLLTSVLAASFGVLVSLRAASVRQAQQMIAATLGIILLLHVVVAPLVIRILPSGWRISLDAPYSALSNAAVVAGVAVVLLIANVLLLHTAVVWFRRCRLHTH